MTDKPISHEDMRARYANPVPPAGGESVKRYNPAVSHGGSYEHVVLEEFKNGYVVKSVDHDAIVTRLQAEVGKFKKAAVYHSDKADEARAERDALQSELTKARGLMASLKQEAQDVCWAIEECGASVELTNAVTKASALVRKIETFQSAPADKGQGEPVVTAEMEEAGCQAYMDADGMIGIMHSSSMGHAYRAMRALEQPAPIAVVMPSRRSWSGIASWKQRAEINVWNACLDEVARLNKPNN